MSKQKARMYCIRCKTFTEHTSYCEERTIPYLGYMIDYEEEGWICSHCGDEQQTVPQYDKAMEEIRETYYIKKRA